MLEAADLEISTPELATVWPRVSEYACEITVSPEVAKAIGKYKAEVQGRRGELDSRSKIDTTFYFKHWRDYVHVTGSRISLDSYSILATIARNRTPRQPKAKAAQPLPEKDTFTATAKWKSKTSRADSIDRSAPADYERSAPADQEPFDSSNPAGYEPFVRSNPGGYKPLIGQLMGEVKATVGRGLLWKDQICFLNDAIQYIKRIDPIRSYLQSNPKVTKDFKLLSSASDAFEGNKATVANLVGNLAKLLKDMGYTTSPDPSQRRKSLPHVR